jgi:hypothetical protein
MAKINNPRKQFQFTIILPGLNPFLAQDVKIPDVELDIVEHGDTNFDVKTAGRKKTGMLSIIKISASETTDRFFWDWIKSIQNTRSGGGLLPFAYKRVCIVEQYSADGITVVQRWQWTGVWPQKINGIEFSRRGSENTIESIDLCVDEDVD